MFLQSKPAVNFSAMQSVLRLTYHEYVNRKIFIVSVALYSLAILVLIFESGKKPDYLIHPYFLSFLFYFSLISLLLSGFDIVPKMIENGSVELILSRPITRARLLTYNYISTIVIIPIGTFFFFLFISFIYFVKSGFYDFVHMRVFAFTFIAFAVYAASFLPASLLFYRSNVNLLLCMVFIASNAIPNLMYWLTAGNGEIDSNYIMGLLYLLSPRLVELCGFAVKPGAGAGITYTHSVLFISGCLLSSYAIMNHRDF
ncbi:MAG: ABC transporter permease subunit [Candidatus Scalindua sp.]|nr:ABC transporter permease subunit [Candidatus Scalindua sp.]